MSRSKLRVDPEFRSLCPPLSPDEKAQLEGSLQTHGCRDALVVWKGHDLLLDGHNRHELCTKHDITYKTVELEFPDREASKQWIVANQLSRRNLTPEAGSYLRGRRYNTEKKEKSPGRPAKGDQTDRVKTDERLAQEYKVAPATIRRDGRFAKAVDAIAENCGADSRQLILSRDTGLSRGRVTQLAKMKPKEQQELLQELREAGKLSRKRKKGGRRATVTVPTKPKEFGQAVVKKFGHADALELAKAIMEAAKQAKEGDGK